MFAAQQTLGVAYLNVLVQPPSKSIVYTTARNQYNRALQDLVNYIGQFLGFKVDFGRYQGVSGQIGFDGHWVSPSGFHIVVEVKTTEAYAIKTATLVGYIDQLISEQTIPNWERTLGLYVVGRPDPEIRQLENAILAEKRTNLRIISVDALLSLAEMMNVYDVNHEDILALIRPSGPKIDLIVDLMARLVSGYETEYQTETEEEAEEIEVEANYWLTPVKSDEEGTAEENIQTLVGKEHIYAIGNRTPGRQHIKPGDWICFYATGNGVVAHAKIISRPEKNPNPKVRQPEKYPWVFNLEDVSLYLDKPTIIDASLRSQLDAFKERNPNKPWAWFVQSTKNISKHDFEVLTGNN